MHATILLLVLSVCALNCNAAYVRALECGLDSRAGQRELQRIVETCTQKDTNDQGTTDEYDSKEEDSTETSTYGYRDGNSRSKRNDNMNQQTTTSSSTTTEVMEMNTTESENKDSCVIHCVLAHLGMTNNNGYPEYELMSQMLLKRASNRELRDFVQDITNDCFQLMGQGEKQEVCEYSTSLMKCLAQKGKENCADWPMGNLAFLE